MKQALKRLVARLARPALAGLDARLQRLESRLETAESLLHRLAGPDPGKYREELAYWRWLFKSEKGRTSLHAPPEVAFAQWQRDRLRDLARTLALADADATDAELDAALDAWCETRSAVEIGAGPFPALAAAPRWRRAVAVDPLARGYAEEGILAAAADHITYVEAPGEDVPLPAGCADLVIIENALDHVSDPGAVLAETFRLLRPGGLLWLLVDLSTYSDHMHPHPFDEARVKTLLRQAGFVPLSERTSDHKSHPKAYGEYRGLLRKPGEPAATVPAEQFATQS